MSDSDVAAAIDAEAVPVTLKTRAAGSYNADGDWVAGTVQTATVSAAVQPAQGVRLQDLPEGIRTEAEYFIWTRAAVKIDDVVTYDGNEHRVIWAKRRPDGGYTRAVLGRLA